MCWKLHGEVHSRIRNRGKSLTDKIFGVNVEDTDLIGINYKLANATEKWDAFLKITDINQIHGFSDPIKNLQIPFASKNFENSKLSYETCWRRFELIKQEFRKFSNICSERSEICKYWRSMLKLISLLKGFVEAVSEGNWEVHFHTMQRLLSVFCILDSIHYLRNTSWYLEKMRKFPKEYPQKYKHSQERKFLVKTNAGYFK